MNDIHFHGIKMSKADTVLITRKCTTKKSFKHTTSNKEKLQVQCKDSRVHSIKQKE